MGYSSLDHSILKGALVGVVKLTWSQGSRYPSLLIIMEGLRRLENDFVEEHKVEQQLSGWEQTGYRLGDFRRRFDREKLDTIKNEYNNLKRTIEYAESVRLKVARLPMGQRQKLEQLLFADPTRAREIERQLSLGGY